MSLHHSRLIRILICDELERRKDTWVSFLNKIRFGFSTQNTEITSKPDSSQEKDKEEGLSDEDNHPLSDRLKERIHNKRMQEQRNAKKSGIKTSRKKKRGWSTSEWQKSTKKHKERHQKDNSTIPDPICSQTMIDIPT